MNLSRVIFLPSGKQVWPIIIPQRLTAVGCNAAGLFFYYHII